MSDDRVYLSLKIREIEIEYEGPENILVNDISNTVDSLVKCLLDHTSTTNAHQRKDSVEDVQQAVQLNRADLSVSTIASRMGASSAVDLVKASAAYLILVNGKEEFSRKELVKAMQSDKSRYKRSTLSNLTATLARLVSQNSFNELSSGSYSLTAIERNRLEMILDQ